MSRPLFACIHAAEFPAQALLRLRTDLQAEAVAVVKGRAPEETVCAMNRLARLKGVGMGMTRLEAEELTGLQLLHRSRATEAAARDALLECAARFSPRIEDVSEGTACSFVLDIAGTERLFGPPRRVAERLRAALLEAGFRVSIAVSRNFDAARMKAAASRGIAVIPDGQEAAALEKLPLAALHLDPEREETFALWGICTLGELAALPQDELVARMGHAAQRWLELARGIAVRSLQAIEPAFVLQEYCAFDTPVEQAEALLFMVARMMDCLMTRAAARAMALASLTASMHLEGGRMHRCVMHLALPSTDRKFLLKLVQLELAAHPPQAAVLALELTGEAGQSSKVQLGLFAPQIPEPSRLDVTLARLKALVGEDRVGSVVLEDTHKPSSFHMKEFAVSEKHTFARIEPQRMALRRIRPPVVVRVTLRDARPAVMWNAEHRYEVTEAYGPWRTSGCWWSDENWDVEEWDVLAAKSDGVRRMFVLVLDCARRQWQLEACYD
ncbi:MAG: DNA polymerase Y family protein [Terracidiphilus sp.]